jgi:hypothetical protein
MQRERASIPKAGLVIRSLDLSKREKSEISGEISKNLLRNLKP